jgi:hypothetical protein
MCLALVLAIAATATASTASDGGAWVVDRVIVAVPEAVAEKGGGETGGKRPITQSELDFEARVALIRQGGILAATRTITEELLTDTLDYVIGQNLAQMEIQRLKIDEPDESEVTREREAFANRFPTPSTYQAFLKRYDAGDPHVGEEALTAILRRDLRVARYFERRVRLMVRIDEGEVKKYIAEHPEAMAALDKQAATEAVRAKLARERAAEITRHEMAAIRERHRFEVQMIAPIARHARSSEASSSVGANDGGLP